MNGEEAPLKEAGGDGSVGPSHARAPLPLQRSILWTPRGVSAPAGDAPPSSTGPYELFLQHGVLAGINWHVGRDAQESHFGFLLGRLFRCPDSGIHYTVADTAVAARGALDEAASADQLMQAWSEAKSVFSGHPGHLVGWYHSHYLQGLVLSEPDLDTNDRYFSAPWQCSIVVVPDPNRPLGGVFRAPTADAESAVRPSRFYELLDEPPVDDAARADSAVVWMNYEADRKVRAPAAPETRPANATPPPATETPPGAGETPPGAAQDPGRLAPRRTPPFPEPGQEEPPGGIHLVIPGEGGPVGLLPPRSRRIGRPLLILAAAGLAAAAVFLFLPDVWSSLTTAEPDAPPPAAPPTENPDAGPSPELERLLSDVEALEIAGERYRERAGDFEAGLIGCPLLTTGYVAADEAYVRVAESYGGLGAENPRATAAYEGAGAEMAEVNEHFDASGCQRP